MFQGTDSAPEGPCTLTTGFCFCTILDHREPGYSLPISPERAPQSQMIGLYIIMEMGSQKAKQDGKMPNYALAFILLDSITQAFFFFTLLFNYALPLHH